ncbi:retrotransposon-derived protein PEG10 [Corythoichthys intestinalis]|uniref:retrotransposon-derived protein PEG10 n=1 Tax=Corythoichthys intestinalis TaxID=161448 RepID=UPI0025A61275|nr:retrotransposon-derived protein PEG10 [Corythoichthys intestinalis]
MDPADNTAGSPTSLADHHQAIDYLFSKVTDITHALQSIQAQLTPLPQARTAPSPLRHPTASPSHTPVANPASSATGREPHVPAPAPYDGNLGTCRAFLVQCSLVFEQQPSMYQGDRAKIAYLIGSMRGTALDWASSIWEQGSPLCTSYSRFTEEMRKIFDHPVRGREAAKRIMSVRQGSRSVAEFSIEFRTLAAESRFNDAALQEIFTGALNESLKDELATRDEPDSLDSLIRLSIQIDNRQRERRRQRKEQPGAPRTRFAALPSPPPLPVQVTDAAPATPPPADQPEPMQLGRTRLSQEERTRRYAAQLCIYCGQGGHFIRSCPVRPGNC